ncbi:MAG: hypothetical protein WD926_01580 [Patescibacteria group bacterium]
MIRHGVVTEFKGTHGQIQPVDGGKPVPFHLKGRRKVILRREAVALDDSSRGTGTAVPRQGDRLVFEVRKSKRRRARTTWAFKTPYDMAQGTLNKMPRSRIVKVVKLLDGSFGLSLTPEIVWVGKDHGQVGKRFPQLKSNQPERGRFFNLPTETVHRLETEEDGEWPNDAIEAPTDPTPVTA